MRWPLLGFAAVLLAGCTITLPSSQLQQVVAAGATELPDGSEVGTAVQSYLAADLVRFGILQDVTDFAGVALGFTVWDADRQPVPFADVLVDFGEAGRMRIGSANQDGQITLTFSEELILLDPVVYGMRDGNLYRVRFDLTAEMQVGDADGGPLVTVDLRTLEEVQTGDNVLFHERGLTPEVIDSYVYLLDLQEEFIREELRIEPIPWGMALVDREGNITVSPSRVVRNGREVIVFPFSLQARWKASGAQTNLHEWVEQSLFHRFPELPRWVADGIAEVANMAIYRRLSEEEIAKWEVREWVESTLGPVRTAIAVARAEDPAFDLLAWPWVGEEARIDDPAQWLGYRVSQAFWFEVAETHGWDVIAAFVAELPAGEEVTNAVAVEALEQVTGRDYTERLRVFPLDDVLGFYDRVEQIVLE